MMEGREREMSLDVSPLSSQDVGTMTSISSRCHCCVVLGGDNPPLPSTSSTSTHILLRETTREEGNTRYGYRDSVLKDTDGSQTNLLS